MKATPCPDPRCGLSFDAVVDLQYHAQDTYYYKRTKASTSKRRYPTNRPYSKAEDNFIAFTEPVYALDSPGGNHQSYFVEEAAVMSNSETADPTISPRDYFGALLSLANPQLSEVTTSADSCRGLRLDLPIDLSLYDLELTKLASPMSLRSSYASSKRNYSSTDNSPSGLEPRTLDAVEAP